MKLARTLTPDPTSPQLSFSLGDYVVLTLYAQDNSGTPVNIAGATFSTQILGPNGVGPIVFGNAKHAIVASAFGQFTLTLGTVDTAQCGLGPNKDILTTITIGGNSAIFQGQGILVVEPPVPIQ